VTGAHNNDVEITETSPDWILIGYIVCVSIIYCIISGRRFFNFDEFQVMYVSAGIIRKGTLYADEFGHHFPLANLIMGVPCRIVGFDAAVLIIARYVILALNGIMLFYAYRIGSLLWSRRAGFLAVSMVLSSFVFLEKGIEIRHDVFNTLFNIMGIYYGIIYLKRRSSRDLLVSALCFGMAAASTQKASVIIAGFLFGLVIYLMHERDYNSIRRMLLGYLLIGPVPIVGCLIFLVCIGGDSLDAFLQNAVGNVIARFAPLTKEVYPFPYKRMELFQTLFLANPLFYVLGVGTIVSTLSISHERSSKRVIIGICAAVGLAFYLTSKRPFFQTFLPVIPLLAILGGGLLSNTWDSLADWRPVPKSIVGILCLLLLLFLPMKGISSRIRIDKRFEKALANTAFCVENLDKEDKVLCFTQNQIFFDSLMKIRNEECGESIYDFDVDCFERKMIEAQCKVVINDYRTQLLGQEIKRRIAENYVRTKTGDILIPGFQIPPRRVIFKKIWIKGAYYSPTHSLEVDGKSLDEKIIPLKQGSHSFRNETDRPVTLVYLFDPDSLKRDLEIL
jgi:hypothetical protein